MDLKNVLLFSALTLTLTLTLNNNNNNNNANASRDFPMMIGTSSITDGDKLYEKYNYIITSIVQNLTTLVLKREGLDPDCWSTVGNLKLSCTYDVVRFFLNGHTGDIASSCCRAISNVAFQCFPGMAASLDAFHRCCDADQVAGSPETAVAAAPSPCSDLAPCAAGQPAPSRRAHPR